MNVIKKMLPLINEPHRYKVLYGGRGGLKSWFVAELLAELAARWKCRILCCREIQNSIKDSVHKLLCDTIERLEYQPRFTITDTEIRSNTGSLFVFKGLRTNITEVKSLEGVDRVWVEEAEKVSKESWEILIPTIRREGSEFFITFNTGSEDDETYRRFVMNPPDDCLVVKTTYLDNKWCPETLIKEAEYCKAHDLETYNHVWLGDPRSVGGRVYPAFNQAVHVRDDTLEHLLEAGQFFMAMDPHTIYYPACVWGAKIPKGHDEFDYVVYNEFPFHSMFGGKRYAEIRQTQPCTLTCRQLTMIFNTLDGAFGHESLPVRVTARGLDTRFAKSSGAKSWATGAESIITTFALPENGGMVFEMPREAVIDAQRDALRKLLYYNEDMAITAFNTPHLYILPHCKNTIDALNYHRFDMDNVRESERHKDFSDALNILLATMAGHEYVDPRPAPKQDAADVIDRLYGAPVHEGAMA